MNVKQLERFARDYITTQAIKRIVKQLAKWDYVPSATCIWDLFPCMSFRTATNINIRLQLLKHGRIIYKHRKRPDALQKLLIHQHYQKRIETFFSGSLSKQMFGG